MTRLAIVESKLLLRDPVGLAIGLVPPILTVRFGYQEASMLVAIAIPGLILLPTRLARYRERGVLRRLATTPVRPVSLLGAQVAVHAVVAVVGGALAFGLGAPARVELIVLAWAVFALGLVIAAVAPSARTAAAAGALVCSAALGAVPRPLPLAVLAVCAAGFGAVAIGLFRLRQS